MLLIIVVLAQVLPSLEGMGTVPKSLVMEVRLRSRAWVWVCWMLLLTSKRPATVIAVKNSGQLCYLVTPPHTREHTEPIRKEGPSPRKSRISPIKVGGFSANSGSVEVTKLLSA